jgi:hypothetical protein
MQKTVWPSPPWPTLSRNSCDAPLRSCAKMPTNFERQVDDPETGVVYLKVMSTHRGNPFSRLVVCLCCLWIITAFISLRALAFASGQACIAPAFVLTHPGGNKLDGLTLMQRKRQSYGSVKSTSGGISDVHISAHGAGWVGHLYHRSGAHIIERIPEPGCIWWRVV